MDTLTALQRYVAEYGWDRATRAALWQLEQPVGTALASYREPPTPPAPPPGAKVRRRRVVVGLRRQQVSP